MATASAAAPANTFELASIPISDITIQDGFNPRGEVTEDQELQALAATIRAHGCLLPIRVRRDGKRYVLIAGERRYRAATLAGLTEIPASILPQEAVDEPAERLTEALIENELRSGLDPLHRAHAYKALLEQGLTVRGVAERLGGTSGRRSRETRIKEHLSILTLPEALQEKIGAGEIPLLAVPALVELAGIHEDLAHAALKAVEPDGEYEEPFSWTDVAAAPLQTAVSCCEPLPAGLYSTRESYPLERFELTEQAKGDLAVLAEHGHAPEQIRFTGEITERAAALGALREAGWLQVIVGQDVADTLAADWLATARKRTEEHAARSDTDRSARAGGEPGEDPTDVEKSRQQAAAERDRQRQERQQATTYNLTLGVLAFKHLARVKVDERVIRILASVDLGGAISGIAARGARLCAPGWITQEQQKNGRIKTGYLDAHDAQQKAVEFLNGAETASEVAGRALTLIALARYADEDAVAVSNRSYHQLSFRGAWGEQAEHDLAALTAERVKAGELPGLDERLGRDTDSRSE